MDEAELSSLDVGSRIGNAQTMTPVMHIKHTRKTCDRLFWKLARWITPGLVNSQRRYLRSVSDYITSDSTWLDLGCGGRLVPAWLPEADRWQRGLVAKAKKVIGIDCDHASLTRNNAILWRILSQGSQLPFADDSFDLITANMVVEHLPHPLDALEQINRVLKPGGHFVFHTPNILHPINFLAAPVPAMIKNPLIRFLEARVDQDVFPAFYRMNRIKTIRRLAENHHLIARDCRLVESSPTTLMLGPLVVFEMIFTRLTRLRMLESLRSNIIAVLQKPHATSRYRLTPKVRINSYTSPHTVKAA